MRSPAKTRSPFTAPRSTFAGFTLIEMLAVTGIIALIVGGSLAGINAARKSARRIRVKDDLHMIEVALDQYRSDFQDYPRFADPSADVASLNLQYSGLWLDTASDRGARLLCQALIAPGPAGTHSYADKGEDGADGPGFRIRRNGAGGFGTNGGGQAAMSGKVYGPYLDTNKFKLEFTQGLANMQDAKILDYNGNPILYYVALPNTPGGSFVNSLDPRNYQSNVTVKPYYNSFDNSLDTTTSKPLLSTKEMQYLLGDANNDGVIAGSETAVTTQQYLLWTAGADGIYGRINGQGQVDDLTNFEFPAGMKK